MNPEGGKPVVFDTKQTRALTENSPCVLSLFA